MKNTKTTRIILSLLQIAILIASHFVIPLSDGILVFVGIALIIAAYFLKVRYGDWGIVLAYPITYVLANLLDKPHPIDGRLPNNLYPLWYIFFIGSCLALLIFEIFLRNKKVISKLYRNVISRYK